MDMVKRTTYRLLLGQPYDSDHLEDCGNRTQRKREKKGMECILLAQDRARLL